MEGEWLTFHRTAILEGDQGKMPQRIEAALTARLQMTADCYSACARRAAMLTIVLTYCKIGASAA
jgi:hypothetical protein